MSWNAHSALQPAPAFALSEYRPTFCFLMCAGPSLHLLTVSNEDAAADAAAHFGAQTEDA